VARWRSVFRPTVSSRELMNLEIAAICDLGVDLRLNVSVGKDVTIPPAP